MRIKNYENWRLKSNLIGNISLSNIPKDTQDFSISQLLETPKKSQNNEDKHCESMFFDLRIKSQNHNLNRRMFNRNNIQINQMAKLSQRQENIKNKIKERLKQENTSQNITQIGPGTFFRQQKKQRVNLNNLKYKKLEANLKRVFVKGNSLAFNFLSEKKRTKSTAIRKSLPNFDTRENLRTSKVLPSKEQTSCRQSFYSVQMKRNNSSRPMQLKKTYSFKQRKNSLRDIQPWQFDQEPQIFQI